MLIQPTDSLQPVTFRARPHIETDDYFLVAWTNTQKVFGIIDVLDYFDGSLTGNVSFPLAVGLNNGAQIHFRCFPISDLSLFETAIEEAFEDTPTVGTIEAMNQFILEQIDAENIAPEVYRGPIFVSTQLDQPYSIT